MSLRTSVIANKANALIARFGTRDPEKLAEALGVTIIPCHFKVQKGAYKVVLRNRFIFIKEDLDPVMRSIVLLHELGHDQLHRKEAARSGGFSEFNIFEMRENRMEYEANIFASQISLPDDEILDYIESGYDIRQIAKAMHSDINLVALKNDTLISQGRRFRAQDHRNTFLRYNPPVEH